MMLSSSKIGLDKRNLQVKKKSCKRITDLPDDCLSHVYKRLKSDIDIRSFGLVCRHWLHIQNNNHDSLWDLPYSACSLRKLRKISPESFSIILCKLLIRFRHLKSLCLSGLPEVTGYVISVLQLFGQQVRFLDLMDLSNYSHKKLCLIFSSLPDLTFVRLSGTRITDKGLEVLANSCASLTRVDLEHCQQITDKGLEVLSKCCVSLGKVDLENCQRITDSGISFLIQNCPKLHSTVVSKCNNITGIGFLGCPKTLTWVWARRLPKLTTDGINAIVSGGGIQALALSGKVIDNKAIITVSKSCPFLKILWLDSCHEKVHLEAWKAVGHYCRNLESLYVYDCPMICDEGLKALCYGSKNLSYIDGDDIEWSFYARDLFKRERSRFISAGD